MSDSKKVSPQPLTFTHEQPVSYLAQVEAHQLKDADPVNGNITIEPTKPKRQGDKS